METIERVELTDDEHRAMMDAMRAIGETDAAAFARWAVNLAAQTINSARGDGNSDGKSASRIS